MSLTEDDTYRSSTQYRLWSFTSESLASLRASTNKSTTERVIAAINRHRARHQSPNNGTTNSNDTQPSNPQQPIDTLTPHEELLLITHYTRQLLTWSQHSFHHPSPVTHTAALYLRRFYLANSPMTYHPKSIFPTCLFLATKTQNHNTSLDAFARRIHEPPIRSKLTGEAILAPEFIVCLGLRWGFDVRLAGTGLQAGWMELLCLARAEPLLEPRSAVASTGGTGRRTAADLQAEMLSLAPPNPQKTDEKPGAKSSVKDFETRIGTAYAKSKELLNDAALLTDAYFLYTPPQIWLAALLVADEPLTLFYLSTKFPSLSPFASASTSMTQRNGTTSPPSQASSNEKETASAKATRILSTLRACASLLSSHPAPSSTSRDELVRIDKKLYACLNPEKRDLVSLNRAAKTGGAKDTAAAADTSAADGREDDENGGGGGAGRKRPLEDPAAAEASPKKKQAAAAARTDADDIFGEALPGRRGGTDGR